MPLFRIADGAHLRTFATTGTDVAFTPDGQALVIGANEPVIRMYQAGTGELRHTLTGLGLSVAVSPNGQVLAAPGWNKDTQIHLWDIATGASLANLHAHNGQIHGLAFSPDGNFLVAGANDGAVVLWRVADWTIARRGNVPYGADSVAFSPDGATVAIGTYQGLYLWQLGDAGTKE